MAKKVFVASDHAGFALKEVIVRHLKEKNYEAVDLGPEQAVSCDYPDSAFKVTDKVLENEDSLGILICGTGIGMSMAANRVKGIRAALATCEFHARACREHNNANILCLGERVTGAGVALNLVDIFLETEFAGGRHLRRIELFNNK